MSIMRYLIIVTAAFAVVTGKALGQDPTEVVGCWFATPALSYSFSGNPESTDTSWNIVQMFSDGSVRRPMLRPGLDRQSRWRLAGDTLVVIVHDGLVGWRLKFTRTSEDWAGTGTYLTDVMVENAKPAQRTFTLKRRACAGSA